METRTEQTMQYLWGAREAKAEIRRRRLRVQELEARCTSMTAKMNGMPGGGGDRHALEQAYIALAEARDEELAAERDEIERHREIEALIEKLEKPEHRVLLRHRYLRGLKFSRVHREMAQDGYFYCERQIYRLHDEAVACAARLLFGEEGVAFETQND